MIVLIRYNHSILPYLLSISFCNLLFVLESRSSSYSINCSGGSLSSLRRRWNQSVAKSMASVDSDDNTPRVRTKLGIALVLNLSGPIET